MQIHLQNVRLLERLGNGLPEKAVLAQVDIQKLHALAGHLEQALQRPPRSRRPLSQRAETKAVGCPRQAQQFVRDINEIISDLGDDEEIGVPLVIQPDFDSTGRVTVLLLKAGDIHSERGDLFERLASVIVSPDPADDDPTVAE